MKRIKIKKGHRDRRFLFTTFHERRRDELLKDPKFRKAYEQALGEIKENNE